MKEFKLFLESIQGLFLEANFKPLHTVIQNRFLLSTGVWGQEAKEYTNLTDEQKKEVQNYIDSKIKHLTNTFERIPNITENEKQWIINVFVTKQQDFVTDIEKIYEQMITYLELKRRDKLNKKDKNLNNLTYNDFVKVLKKYELDLSQENDFGKNPIIHEDGEWKIIEFKEYQDALPFVQGSKSNWCIKYQHHWDEYEPPYYAFYKNNRAYALFHQGSVQLKDKDDEPFKTIEPEFEKQISQLFRYIRIKDDLFDELNDLEPLLDDYYEKYYSFFTNRDIVNWVFTKFKIGKNFDNMTQEVFDKYFKPLNPTETIQNISYPIIIERFFDFYGTKLNGSELLIKEIYKEDFKKAYEIIESGVDLSLNLNHYNTSPWMLACDLGHYTLIRKMIDKNKNIVHSKDKQGRTALLRQIAFQNRTYVKLLLEIPEIDCNESDYSNYDTPLSMAVVRDFEDIVELLLKHPKIKVDKVVQNNDITRNNRIFKLFLNHPAVDPNTIYRDEEPLLIHLAFHKYYEKFIILLDCEKTNINIQNKNGKTALIEIIKPKSIGATDHTILNQLLTHDKINVNIQDNHGRTALMWASVYNENNVVRKLLEIPNINIDIKDNEGKTRLELAEVRYNTEEICARLRKYKESNK